MKTRWSQNFLTDANIARKCVDAIFPQPSDPVLEIGPGKGMLTRILAEKSAQVTAIEIDPELCVRLSEKFSSCSAVTVEQSDFLDFPLARLKTPNKEKFKVIGNLPYAVVSPIVQKVLGWNGWSMAVFMVQKEVADRMTAVPHSKIYGLLTVSVQSRCTVRKLFAVSRHCFLPKPDVESCVIRLDPLAKPLFTAREEKSFFKVVRACFAYRRKTVLNSLKQSLDLPAESLRKALESCAISPESRAETLSLVEFKKLSDAMAALT